MIDVSLQVEDVSKRLDLQDACIETIMCRMALRGWNKSSSAASSEQTGTTTAMTMSPILEMCPHGNVVCVVSFIKKKPVVLAREHEVIKLIVQYGTPVTAAQLTKDQNQKRAYSSYSSSSNKFNRYGKGGSGGGRGGRGGRGGGRYNGRDNGRDNDSSGGYGGSNKCSTTLSFNVDEVLAMTSKFSEKDFRRTLDRLRYQGEITTSWEGRALRAKMMEDVPNDDTLIEDVANDLFTIANTLASSTVSKVEGMFKLATRAAVDFAPKKEPSSKLSMAGDDGAFAQQLPLLNSGLERYFQDKEDNERVETAEIAAVVEVTQSAYEIARLERIRKNNEEMVRLGLMDAADAMRAQVHPTNNREDGRDAVEAVAQGGDSDDSDDSDDVNDITMKLSEVPLPFALIDVAAAALLRSDVRVLLQNQLLANNSSTTPRVITRIFHGLGSPAFPSPDFWNTTFWNRHRRFEFNMLLEFVSKTMRELKLSGARF